MFPNTNRTLHHDFSSCSVTPSASIQSSQHGTVRHPARVNVALISAAVHLRDILAVRFAVLTHSNEWTNFAFCFSYSGLSVFDILSLMIIVQSLLHRWIHFSEISGSDGLCCFVVVFSVFHWKVVTHLSVHACWVLWFDYPNHTHWCNSCVFNWALWKFVKCLLKCNVLLAAQILVFREEPRLPQDTEALQPFR